MSFSTVMQIALGKAVDLKPHEQAILRILEQDRIHPDLYEDLLTSFQSGESSFNCHAAYLYELLPKIVKLLPDASFDARGLGEEFAHTWVQIYNDGALQESCATWEHGISC